VIEGTTQVCNFRDSYNDVTSTGFAVYGLSKDSTKANTTFKEKQNLQYPLLCDPNATLISAIGLKKEPSGTTRGVFVIDKEGKVLAAQPGSPGGTLDVVKKIVSNGRPSPTNPNVQVAVENNKNGANAADKKVAAPNADAAN
jgi:peroxiredoxin Q/BCP